MTSKNSSFFIGQKIGPYEVRDAHDRALIDPDRKAAAIGVGASAEVCLVQQTLTAGVTIDRALKYYSPNSKILERRKEAGLSQGEQSFLAEIKAISTFNHQNLVKIVDAGQHVSQPYFVMEYVDGFPLLTLLDATNEHFSRWHANAQRDPFLALRMARQICWPLSYLHSFRFFHFDVAPKNIFVRTVGDKPHIILGDLGVGQTVPLPNDPSLDNAKDIFIGGTREYTPNVLHPYLNYREHKLIPAAQLARYAMYWDVYAVATVLEEMIDKWELTNHIDLVATKILCKRAKLFDEGFSALRFTNELERLLPAQVLTAGVQELSSDAFGKRTYVPIPLYSVPISERLQEITRHPLFVRLQRVPQFLLGRTVFPGGVHSRYEHALGTYALGQRYLVRLLANPEFRADFSKKELEEAIITIMLTKLVSFVFDYAFFEMTLTHDGKKDETERQDRLNMFLSLKSSHDQLSLSDVIKKMFPDVDLTLVVSILCGRPPEGSRQARLISGIVKSSIDVRVFDYLGRDSHHTSIPAGSGVDINQIIESLTWNSDTGDLGITTIGVFSVEHLLCARYWMYNRVYWNTINRSLAAMIRYTLFAMLRTGDMKTNQFIREIMNFDEPSALAWLDQHWNGTAGDAYKHFSIIPLLTLPRPRPFRVAIELSGKTWSENYIESARNLPPERMEALRMKFIRECTLVKKLRPCDVLFDIPRDKSLKVGEDICVQTPRGWEKLSDASEIVRALPKAFLETAFKFRVFYNPEAGLTDHERDALGREATQFLEAELA